MPLPESINTVDSFLATNGTWCGSREHRTLVKSTGHALKHGKYVGDDDFFVSIDTEKPGIGSLVNFLTGPDFGGGPLYPDYRTYSWRPVLSRQYNSEYYLVDTPGVYSPLYHDQDYPDVLVPEFSEFVLDLNDKGTNFIKLARPGNPLANMGQFLIELRDFPRIPLLEAHTKFLVGIGSEFLNIEFGWKPLINDLRKAYKLSRVIDKRLSQLVRNNGIPFKRKRTHTTPETVDLIDRGETWESSLNRFPFGPLQGYDPEADSVFGPDDYVVFGPDGGLVLDPGGTGFTGSLTWKRERVTKRHDWFVGTFLYNVPNIGTLEWTDKARIALFELNITPSVIYEVYPWSWLIDWFSNVGDIVSNLSANAVDHEALTDSFVMSTQSEETRITAVTTWDDYDNVLPNGHPIHLSSGSDTLVASHLVTNKLRHPASPFGFGVSSSSFSSRQWAILSALGLTHQRFL